ncbi:alpha/beta fold hydrolase [Niabella drilacis]|uniref:Pimeloyl-ACP methyl ester carboxylesterase n=1 Tax=Niabella drilacis (strain DSM 25811 / CCM 8410 / CCUG 62505 / LMG 26954 / E90) TaxID=1285928 RepID=A0A1G6KUM2_NIADE|nr:alpha/beta hydrolase [Niabella drilacis]SDC34779.1 Pimeloyl-ACP methyl ester carboxylesterase [Niabella drilacis]
MNLYCIPGFGVDERIYGNLSVGDVRLCFLNWLEPEPGETLNAYARRMAEGIHEEDAVLVGISFGGMVALEIAGFRSIRKVILISSIKQRSEMPWHMRLAGLLRLNRVFPVRKIQQSDLAFKIANRRLGANTKDEQEFANTYRKTAKLHYVNWSFDQILNWRNTAGFKNVVQIHGDRDRIFPIKNIAPDYIIKGGTHMMVWNRAAEISAIIKRVLDTAGL